MKIGFVSLFALALGACPLAAQYTHVPQMQVTSGTAGTGGVQTLVIVPPPLASNCPVSMRAQHLSDGNLVRTGKAAHPAGIGQRLHLTLKTPHAEQVAGAQVTIRGTTPKGRVMQASSTDSSDAMRELSVSFSTEPDGSASADLWVPGVTAIQSIELDSVSYSDGSTWKAAAGDACRITPDPLMLISGR